MGTYRYLRDCSTAMALGIALDVHLVQPRGIVRGIDNTIRMDDIALILKRDRIAFQLVHGNVVVGSSDMHAMLDRHVLTGYDEIWLFEGAVPPECIDRLESISGAIGDVPYVRIQAFDRVGCRLALGDGMGLRVLYSDQCRHLIDDIERQMQGLA